VLLDQRIYTVDPVTGALTIPDLPIGAHILSIRRDGYVEQQRTLDIQTGDNPSLAITLEPLKGVLSVKPDVDGAAIAVKSIDRDQQLGSYAGTIDRINFPPGGYEITISKTGYATATRTVTLKGGATVELEPRLDRLPPPKPPDKPRPRPMSARVEVDGKYLIVHLGGASGDDATTIGSINVSVSKSNPTFPEVSGTLNGSPVRIDFFKMENIDEWSLIETPSPANQYSVIVARVRPKDAKRPIRFAINWRSVDNSAAPSRTSMPADQVSEAVAIYKALPTLPAVARSSQTRGAVNVSVVIDESGNVISAKAFDGPIVLRQAAEDAARKWKFRPATRRGIPIQTSQTIRFNFEN